MENEESGSTPSSESSSEQGTESSSNETVGSGWAASGARSPAHSPSAAALKGLEAKESGGKGKAAATADDDMEEISVGSVKTRVPKSLAQAVKALERGFHQKSQEAAQLRRESQSKAEFYKENPDKLFEEFGLDADSYSEARLAKKLEQLSMSPEERERQSERAELEKYKKAEREHAEHAKREAEERETTETSQKLDQELAEAWKESGLPSDLYFVKQMAALMHTAERMHAAGRLEKSLTAKEAASIIKNRFDTSTRKILSGMDPQGIHGLLGEEKFQKLNEWNIGRATHKAAPPSLSGAPTRPGNKPASSEAGQISTKNYVNEREYRKLMRDSF